ncbi:pentapeptide repeat-containing protein [Nonomuraea sp. NN258]|uniref:pentapeptide repeat-containing protein n=1 Tax=Nonomuraea antri TaxID=2730852 RepID=UPI001568E963|nr:pentapeptide repeat-containing protein [Nonomuraea antri]NRQ37902.1 pentapeptide repeat-containing protein [Nonomuraea antri]
MSPDLEHGWPRCNQDACVGVRVSGRNQCLAHVDGGTRDEALRALSPDGELDLRGVQVSAELLAALLRAMTPKGGTSARLGRTRFDHTRFERADFSGVEFTGDASFQDVRFGGRVDFGGARFRAGAAFVRARFVGQADFSFAGFGGVAAFDRAVFSDAADFDDVVFEQAARFPGSTFRDEASFCADFHGRALFGGDRALEAARFETAAMFREAVFHAAADFAGVRFEKASFRAARFDGRAAFGGAEFVSCALFDDIIVGDDARFAGAAFPAGASFGGATFAKLLDLSDTALGDHSIVGPCVVDALDLTRAKFGRDVLVSARLAKIVAIGLRCPEGLNLRLDGAVYIDAPKAHSPTTFTLRCSDGDVTVAHAVFDRPTIIGATPDLPLPGVSRRPLPRLLTLRKVDATNLTLAGLDLAACRFLDCFNRDQLRIDGPPRFTGPPRERRWTRRLTLAEEHLWRVRHDRRPEGWFPESCRHPGESEPARLGRRHGAMARREAARIQAVYRDLRKGREDGKDEPGAADFYYGEMEMRRLAAAPRGAERALLTAYWLISGYGQRASRALTALALLLLLGTVGFATAGFAPSTRVEYRPVVTAPGQQPPGYRPVTVPTGARPGWGDALEHSVNSATSLLRAPQTQPLTPFGRVCEICLRLLGPLLFGLAVLAIRGRVKR